MFSDRTHPKKKSCITYSVPSGKFWGSGSGFKEKVGYGPGIKKVESDQIPNKCRIRIRGSKIPRVRFFSKVGSGWPPSGSAALLGGFQQLHSHGKEKEATVSESTCFDGSLGWKNSDPNPIYQMVRSGYGLIQIQNPTKIFYLNINRPKI